jgi:hypothetical protein
MPRLPVARQAQAHGLAQVCDPTQHRLVSVHERSVFAPSADNRAGDQMFPRFLDRLSHVHPILRSHGIICITQLGGIGRAKSEEVDDVQLDAAPANAEAQAFTDGRVIHLVISRAGIEHDERRDGSAPAVDLPKEVVAVFAVSGDHG